MKNSIFLLLFLLLLSTSLFAQYPSQQVIGTAGISDSSPSVHMTSAVGQAAIGSGTTNTCIVSQGFIQGTGVPLDSLPYYNIGEIPNQIAYQDVNLVFYLWSKELGVTANLSIEVRDPTPSGEMKFNAVTSRFSFKASDLDKGEFTVVFRAVLGTDTVWQEVPFDVFPSLVPEQTAFGLEPVSNTYPPEDDDSNIIITETSLGTGRNFNHLEQETFVVSIAGKTLVFDANLANKLKTFCDDPRTDIESLNIYAEQIIIRHPLHFAQTSVHIQTRNLTFEGTASNAHINTKPKSPSPVLDISGLPAGNLSLHVETFTSPPDHRFKLIGGDGNKSGDAGNGGHFFSNQELSVYLDSAPGLAGNAGGNSGQRGRFSLSGGKYTWVHPFALRMITNHLKTAYLNGFDIKAKEICDDYVQIIDNYRSLSQWDSLSAELQVETQQLGQEMSTVSQRVASNLDYFGNPAGWVPMLSFEVNKTAFEEEVGRAISILYFCYWVQRENASNEQRISAIQATRTELEQVLIKYQSEYIEATTLLPQLENKAQNITDEVAILIEDLKQLELELLERATYLTIEANKPPKKSLWRKIVKTVGTIAQVVPIYQPALGAIGTGLVTVSEIDFSDPLKAIQDVGSVVQDISKADFGASAANFKMVMDKIDFSSLKGKNPIELAKIGKDLYDASAPVIKTIKTLKKRAEENGVSEDKINVTLTQMKAESPEFTDLANRTKDLLSQKAQFFQEIDATLQTLSTLESNIQQGVIAIGGLNLQAFNASSNRNLRAMIYAKDMENRAKDRLIKYHYYMKKAYEYRLLRSYPSDLNLPQLFDNYLQIVNISDTIQLDQDNSGNDIMEADEFMRFKAIYDDVISNTTETILDIYNTNAPEVSAPLRFDLTTDDLNLLNNQEAVNLNMVERGMFSAYEENIRIRGFKVLNMKMHFENEQPGSFAKINIKMEHSGRSKLKKGGETYLFNHYNVQNSNPIIWADTYDARDNLLDPVEPSPAAESLLFSILDNLDKNNNENLLLYSRPGANADIRITRDDVTSNGAVMVIDSLTFEVIYDFNQLPTSYSTLNIQTNGDLLPYISLNKEDVNERQDGWGKFNRTFFQSFTAKVEMEAPLDYGAWVFDNWTDRFGNIISDQNIIDVNLASSRTIKANYQLIQPELHLPKDTIYVSNEAGFQVIDVENIGTGDMYWFCTGADDWLYINGDTTGLNDGSFQIGFNENFTRNPRITELYVVAGSSIDYIDTVYVVQDVVSSTNGVIAKSPKVEIRPNPATNIITIESIGINSVEFRIYDVDGKMVIYKKDGSTVQSINISSLKSGTYLLQCIDENGNSYVARFIKF